MPKSKVRKKTVYTAPGADRKTPVKVKGPTHPVYIAVMLGLMLLGLVWLVVLAVQIVSNPEMNERELRRLACLSLFWHFLDIVWICVFSFVYLGSVV